MRLSLSMCAMVKDFIFSFTYKANIITLQFDIRMSTEAANTHFKHALKSYSNFTT